jgi:hypothetical protein
MSQGRSYSVSFSGVSVAAVQDLISLLTGAAMAAELHGFELGQITGTTSQNLRFTVKRFTGPTVGSGGSAPTPIKMLTGDAAAVSTARANDTVQMTGTGTVLHSDVFATLNGVSFFWPPNDMPVIGLSQGLSLSLDAAPASALIMSGTLYFRELL